MFVSAQGRRGVSNQLTLGGATDEIARAQTGSIAAAYLLPAIGQVAATITGRAAPPSIRVYSKQTYTYSFQGQHFGVPGLLNAVSDTTRRNCR
jgi:hypothetical protein